MALLTAAVSSGVTPLRLVSPPVDPETGSRRRLRLRDGWRLEGNLHTLGYFAADVCVGTPPKTFELIVDTGSSLMALPCANCGHCGHHKHGARFNPSSSSTCKTFSCNSAPGGMHCHSCVDGGKCGYSVSYQEGSRISGWRFWVVKTGFMETALRFKCDLLTAPPAPVHRRRRSPPRPPASLH